MDVNGNERTEDVSPLEMLAQVREALPRDQDPLGADMAGTPTAVLNGQRRLVYANRAFTELAGAGGVEELCGQRTGQILGCVFSGDGCGESEACSFCGAAQAIGETLRTRQAAARECHLSVRAADRGPSNDFLVRTTPFEISARPFVLVTFTDIADQKQRQSLERIFFHDILNTASSISVYLELLGRGKLEEGSRELVGRLKAICGTLVEEINGQKLMVSAESGTLRVQRNLIESYALARQMVEMWEGQQVAHRRKVLVAPFSDSFSFVSDDALVKRILTNMLKNALEASPEESTVSIAMRAPREGSAVFTVHNPTCMAPLVQKQVFRRYFSTKGQDRGLGTWGMRLLAEQYLGGSVSFTSTAEEGTTFVLALPSRPPGW
jgi:signal transduction histidine kinase